MAKPERSVWAEKAAWSFRKRFTVPNSGLTRHPHRLCGLITKRLFPEWRLSGNAWGAFVPCGWDITEWVKFGEENLIAAAFACSQGSNHYDHTGRFCQVSSHQLGFARPGNLSRQAFGTTSSSPPMKRFVPMTGILHFPGACLLVLWPSNPVLKKSGCYWK